MTANPDEFARQRALDVYRLVDSLPEAAFEDITRLASCLCGAPIALISLIDRDRQWFKSKQGLELTESRRDEAFCDHAIRTPGQLFEVPDAAADARFVDNPFVTGKSAIRFYAGMPLTTPGGAPIGTVCVLDRVPRTLDDSQRAGLSSLARLTMNPFEARRRELEHDRAAKLASSTVSEPGAGVEAAEVGSCSVAIFEVQDLAGAASRIGERALARAMLQLQELLQGVLPADADDSVNYSTGSSELIVLLHGSDTAATLRRLRECLRGFETEYALQVLTAQAHSDFPGEPLGSIFLRADAALSDEKDAYRAAR